MNATRRSYFASTVEAAVAEARMELGEDTLLVEARPLPDTGPGKVCYEVIFELPGETDLDQQAVGHEPGIGHLRREISSLRQSLSQVTAMLRHLAAAAYRAHSDLAPMAARLADAGFPPELVAELLNRVDRRMGYGGQRAALEAGDAGLLLAAEIHSRIRTRPGIGMEAAARKVLVLAGPPGAGKTTTLAKLAVTCGVSPGIPAVLISTDSHRVGAADQLRCFAAVLGLPFVQAQSPGALLRALDEHQNKRLVLIDTPGYSPREIELAREWSRVFSSRREIEVQLVLNATTHYRDLRGAAARWSEMLPSRLIFTHLDEAACHGGMVACAVESQLPVSYVCFGQAVPEDIEEATSSRMLDLALGNGQSLRAAAA